MTIEIIITLEEASRVKLGNAVFGGQIQVPDVHSFTMSQTKKSFWTGFSTFQTVFRRKNIKNIIPDCLK